GTWRRLADEVPGAQYGRFRDDVEAADELLVFRVDLASGPALSFASPADWRWPAVALALLVAMLASAWWRRDRGRASGMLFAPRRTMAGLLARPRSWWPVLGLILAMALAGSAPELVAWLIAPEDVSPVLALAGIALTLALFPIHALVMRVGFRMLSTRTAFAPLLRAAAWSGVPYLLFSLLAFVAVGGQLDVLADDSTAASADAPGWLAALV